MLDDDEMLALFYNESREHLAEIESDLLTLSEQGKDFDEELANCIFRDIHTVKGCAGFFDRPKIEDLAQRLENVLDRVRRRELELSAEILQVLLAGGTMLKQLVENPECAGSVDISNVQSEISRILMSNMSEKEVEEVAEVVDIKLPGGKILFTVNKYDFERAFDEDSDNGSRVYLLEFDLIKDIEEKNKTPWEVISDLLELCVFIDSKVDVSGIGTLDTVGSINSIPFYVLVSAIIDEETFQQFLGIELDNIQSVTKDGAVYKRDRESLSEQMLAALAGELGCADDTGVNLAENGAQCGIEKELVMRFMTAVQQFDEVQRELIAKGPVELVDALNDVKRILVQIENVVEGFGTRIH